MVKRLVDRTRNEILEVYDKMNVDLLEELPQTALDRPTVRCRDCGHEWWPTYDKLQQESGCSKCSGYLPLIQRDVSEILAVYDNANVDLLGDLPKNIKNNPKVKCRDCGHEWWPTYNRLQQRKGCSVCASSKGEKRMIDVCDVWDIKKEPHKTFPECKNKGLLEFDLFVPHVGNDHNGFLFEYQGQQHFEPIDFSGKQTPEELQATLERQQYHDDLKRTFATVYNYRLIAIHHEQYDEIEAIILETIGEENIGLVSDISKPSKLMGVEIEPIVDRQLDLWQL